MSADLQHLDVAVKVPPPVEHTAVDSRVPDGARAAARVLLIDGRGRVLLLEAQERSSGHRWWVAPGGGIEPGETFEAAARRELYEETGLVLAVTNWVWTRRHIFEWQGRQMDQYERFFVVRAEDPQITPVRTDGYVVGHCWWDLREIQESTKNSRLAGSRFCCRRSFEASIPSHR
ncbi:MAG TPA: NUDIX domain-containing protein [Polyangiaceae bacterium]